MIKPTDEQLQLITDILGKSIDQLIKNDSDIFNIDIVMPQMISQDAKLLNRELHETTINHRLAYYIENNLQDTQYNFYKVDIEYNRFYGNLKMLQTVDRLISVRPDILLHTRIDDNVAQQHLLVIEAKKGNITNHDINKINAFISDPHYNYLFGLTVSYCRSQTDVLANLFHFDGSDIVSISLNRKKET